MMAETNAQYVARKRREHEDHRKRIELGEATQGGGVAPPNLADARKRLAGDGAQLGGLALGVPLGAFHLAKDFASATAFAGRLMDPDDAQYSPPGAAAWDQVAGAARAALGYLADRGTHPSQIYGDLNRFGVGPDVRLPGRAAASSPPDDTDHQFRTALKVGEGVFNVGAGIGALAELRSIPELRALQAGAAADPLADLPERMAGYMAGPYEGMGSHAPWPRAKKLPGGFSLPKFILDSPFNRILPPEGTPRGVFFKFHYAIDPSYWGGPVRGASGRGSGWSGAKLGWRKYGPAARAWYGTPWQTKAATYGAMAGLGGAVEPSSRPGDRP